MSVSPRVVYALRDGTARVHVPGRVLPIIIVPELLCTRLTDPDTDELVWNPRGVPFGNDPGPYAAHLERLGQLSAELVPDATHPYELVMRNNVMPRCKHYLAATSDYYNGLADALAAGTTTLLDQGVQTRVYFCGYDWRQDNARSALRLAQMVDEALEETGERKVVLVGHGAGGAIARYYCRALGGESRVHQLFLVGSAMLGAPGAFAALKHGLDGMHVRDIEDDALRGDTGAVVFDCANQAAELASLFAGGAGSGWLSTELLMLLSLAAGRWITRRESRALLRLFPSMYQLLPGALYCKENSHWVTFDPMGTGVAPVGYMVPFPSSLELHMNAMAGILDASNREAQLGTQLLRGVQQFLNGSEEGEASGRTTRNAMPLVALLSRALALRAAVYSELGATTSWTEVLLGLPGVHVMPIVHEAMALVPAFKALFGQAKRSFVDCRNPRRLYEDPHTGLMDVVEERSLCAAHLALAYRFDEALTINMREEKPVSLMTAVTALLGSVLGPAATGALRSMAYSLRSSAGSHPGQTDDQRYAQLEQQHEADEAREQRESQAEQDRRAQARVARTAYLPRNTYVAFGEGRQTTAGCVLQPLAFVSRDDSNLVRTAYVPDVAAEAMGLAAAATGGGGSDADTMVGDGFVSVASARPLERLTSRPIADLVGVSDASHARMASCRTVTDFIHRSLEARVSEFIAS